MKINMLFITMSSEIKFINFSLGESSMELEDSTTKSSEPKVPRIKEVLKERKVLEKKVALSKKRRKDSRYMFYLVCSRRVALLAVCWLTLTGEALQMAVKN